MGCGGISIFFHMLILGAQTSWHLWIPKSSRLTGSTLLRFHQNWLKSSSYILCKFQCPPPTLAHTSRCLILPFPLPAALNSPGIQLSAAVSFSLSPVNTDMEHCTLSLISLKNMLLKGLLRGIALHGAVDSLKSQRHPIPSCAGWSCAWGILTIHSTLTPASHQVAGSLSGCPHFFPLAPLDVLWVLTCHETANFKSFSFLSQRLSRPLLRVIISFKLNKQLEPVLLFVSPLHFTWGHWGTGGTLPGCMGPMAFSDYNLAVSGYQINAYLWDSAILF